MAGYECSDQLNCFGERVDLLMSSGHLALIDQDYKSLAAFSIKTVREGIRWSVVEKKPYQYNWDSVIMMFEKAKVNHIQQIWDICHFGYADDLTPLHPMFPRRFAALCKAFVLLYKTYFPEKTLIVTPINEVSFISWLGGEANGTSPYCKGQGWEVKYALMKAYIEGIEAMKSVDPLVRILTTEPLVNIIAPSNADKELKQKAAKQNEDQFQAVDILCGKICPGLRGKPEYLDLLGFNFYFNNQWMLDEYHFMGWAERFSHREWPGLAELLHAVYLRYEHPIVLTETSHSGIDRPKWMEYIGLECEKTLMLGVPLLGVCLYPIIDRTDWDHTDNWHHSGLWDAELQVDGPPKRVLYNAYASALKQSQKKISSVLPLV